MTGPTSLFVVLFLASRASGPPYQVEAVSAQRATLLDADAGAWRTARAVTWGPVAYETTFRALHGAEGLHLRFDAVDPEPWSTLAKRDDHLWEEEVVEIFLDLDRSGRDYAEIEISPANVVCDVRMVTPWPDKKGDFGWDLTGLETRVKRRTDAAGKVTGWVATAFLPWSGFRSLPSARKVELPPRPGDAWRFNVFRVERPGGQAAPERGVVQAALSPPPVKSFHVPEVFRDFVFAPPR